MISPMLLITQAKTSLSMVWPRTRAPNVPPNESRDGAIQNSVDATPIELSPITEEPLVSVILANYNYALFLPDAVKSLQAQSYVNWELIVCDDGSTDNSISMLEQLARRDDRIKVLSKENGGQASAWNLAYKHASGNIICLMDPDDQFFPNKLHRVVETCAAKPEVGCIYHQSQAVDLDGLPLRQPDPPYVHSGWLFDRALTSGGRLFGVPTSQLCLRREFADIVFPLPEQITYFGDVLIQGMAQFTTKIAGLDVVLSYQVFHGSNHSAAIHQDIERRNAEMDGYVRVFGETQAFVERCFGPDVAARLSLRDVPGLWEKAGALYIDSGKPSGGVHGWDSRELLRNLSSTRRGYVWRLLFLLPSGISQRLLRLWWANAGWKRYVRPVSGLLGLREVRAS